MCWRGGALGGGGDVNQKQLRNIRIKACECAAKAISARQTGECILPMLWSMTVFFEQYIHEGSDGTRKDFGPEEPIELKIVSKE